jgi:hypothetical protein
MRKAVGRGIAVLTLLAAPTVWAGSRLVVVPVVVGAGAEPDPRLLMALGNGLRQNPQWAVEQGDALEPLGRPAPASVSAETLAQLKTKVETAEHALGAGNAAEAETTLTSVRSDLLAAGRKGARGAAADDLTWRTSGLLVAALLGKNDAAGARKLADETSLLFPKRAPVDGDQIPANAAGLLASPSPNLGAKLTLHTRPEGCEVTLGDVPFGKAPVDIAVLPGETYYGQARCPAGVVTPAGPSTTANQSVPRRISVAANESTHSEVLDVEFERAFAADGLRRLRFSSSQERRELEETYARRVAERFDADVVVLASVGELSGADWLSARLYLRSGYLNRQALVRLEAPRANALGRYLATGKEVPGVLRPEEAGQLVAASQTVPKDRPEMDPWYTDIAAWCFVGLGITGTALGIYAGRVADRREKALDLETDSAKQQDLRLDQQSAQTWSNIGVVGGLSMLATGIILLIVPQYNNDADETFVMAPTPLPGGGGLTFGGRF